MSVRISATDWAPGGLSEEDALYIARAMQDRGRRYHRCLDGTDRRRSKRRVYGRMWQTPFADRIRNEVGIATHRRRQCLRARSREFDRRRRAARICAPSRGRTWRTPPGRCEAAARQGYSRTVVAAAVSRGKSQLERNLAARRASRRARMTAAALAGRACRSSPVPARGIGARNRAALAARRRAREPARSQHRRLESVAAEIRRGPSAQRACARRCRCHRRRSGEASVRGARERFGPVHILINNAGQARKRRLL